MNILIKLNQTLTEEEFNGEYNAYSILTILNYIHLHFFLNMFNFMEIYKHKF